MKSLRKNQYKFYRVVGGKRLMENVELSDYFGTSEHERKFVSMLPIALCTIQARYGYKESQNYKYRKRFEEMGYNTKHCVIHHEPNGKISLVPSVYHKSIAHYGSAFISRQLERG